MSGSTRETRGLDHGTAIEAPTDERVGKQIGVAYNWEIWSLLYWASETVTTADEQSAPKLTLSVCGALLAVPLLLDMALGFTTPADNLFVFVVVCWWASILLGILSIVLTVRAKRSVGLVAACAIIPLAVFAVGFLPIWPIIGPLGPIGF